MLLRRPPNTLIVMAALAVLAVATAVWLTLGEDGDDAPQKTDAGSLMLPDFRAAAADIATIALQSADASATLQRTDDGWRVVQRDGYPADTAKVRGILLGLARARLEEPKTGNPDRLPKIGLGNAATVLEAGTADGAPQLVLRIGNSMTRGSERARWTFIRRAADAHAWLVSGLPELSTDPAYYVDKTAVRISAARVGRIKVSHRAVDEQPSDSYTLSRPDPSAEFTVDQVGESETFFAPETAAATAAALDGLRIDDVARRDTSGADADTPLATPPTPLAIMDYYMWDGLQVHLRLFEDTDGVRWMTLDASYDQTVAASSNAPRVMPDAPADGAAEAANLNARWSRWRYRIPTGYGEDDLARSRADFVRPENLAN